MGLTETWGFPAGTYLVLSGTASDPYGGPLVWLRDDVRSLGGRADLSHIRVIAYEGGQHFVSQDPDVLDRMLAINRDPRMGDVYRQYLERFMEITGGGMFVHYKGPSIWSQWGLFGSKEYQGQPRASAPKYDALLRFIEAAQAGG